MREDLNDRPEIRALRRRAYEELDLAIDQSGGELPSAWLLEGDRDLESLRRLGEPEWQLLVRRQTGKLRCSDPQFPVAAWGDAHRRQDQWFGVSLVLMLIAAAVVLAFLPTPALLILAGLAVALVVVLIWKLARRRKLILGGIALITGAIAFLTVVPEWMLVAGAVLLASGTAYLMAYRAGDAAKDADGKSIALRKQRSRHAASSEAASETHAEQDQSQHEPGDPEPPLLR
jgi:hypothetical protein